MRRAVIHALSVSGIAAILTVLLLRRRQKGCKSLGARPAGTGWSI